MPQPRLPPGWEPPALAAPEALRTTIRLAVSHQPTPSLPPVTPQDITVSASTDTGFVIRALLGQGGMGSVLLADQPALNRQVAIKVGRSEQASAMLEAEARTTGSIEHPGVIPVYGLGVDQLKRPALVMRRVVGVGWNELLAEPRHPFWATIESRGVDRLETNLRLLVQVCDTLAAAHAQQVLHRDIKPGNVLVGEFGQLFVSDWGLAIRLGAAPGAHIVGTPAYLAPEMARVDGTPLTVETDVFLVGATLFELIVGRPPWLGANVIETLQRASVEDVPALPDSVDPALAAICRKATDVRPQARYGSMVELRDALLTYLRRRGSVAIAEQARKPLGRLEEAVRTADAAPEWVYGQLAECRFGFTQALREWPGNDVAGAGLEHALELAVGFEVSRENAGAAVALLSEMKHAQRPLTERVEALVEKDRRRRASVVEFEAMVADVDSLRGITRRRFVVTVLVVVTSLMAALGVAGTRVWSSPVGLIAASVLFNVGVWSSLWFVTRKRKLNWLNRALLGSLAAGAAGTFALRLVAWLAAVPSELTIQFEVPMVATCAAIFGYSIHRALFLFAGLMVLALPAIVLAPVHAHEIYSVTMALSFLGVGAWLRSQKSLLSRTRTPRSSNTLG